MTRSAGIIMPISSLPSLYGIGTFGKAAYAFADFLHEAKQSYWQILPLGPTSFGDSPYQSFSTFAGNPYFIDLEMLIEEGVLLRSEVENCAWGSNPRYVDYGKLYENRYTILAIAKERAWNQKQDAINAFIKENQRWLEEYTLYMACKRHFHMQSWIDWPEEDIRLHKEEAVEKYREMLKEDVELFTYIQFVFYQQWTKLKEYIHSLGIRIIGDLPIYVSLDSSDVWSEREFFQLDEKGFPKAVSGCPPDFFTEDGQLWGNPLYDWDKMKQDGYGWWIRRIDGANKLYDVIRIDHFRGLDTYWSVPYGDKTAKNGCWKQGPGMDFVGMLNNWFHDTSFIAEDLGAPTPSLTKLLQDSTWPGMRVLCFAFDADGSSSYLPHRHTENCICYTGTHDNSPLCLWMKEADKEDFAFAKKYLGLSKEEEYHWGIIRGGMGSKAKLFVAQMQDYLGLGKYHRMNTPGTAIGNWQWRALPSDFTKELESKIASMTTMFDRNPLGTEQKV